MTLRPPPPPPEVPEGRKGRFAPFNGFGGVSAASHDEVMKMFGKREGSFKYDVCLQGASLVSNSWGTKIYAIYIGTEQQ